MLVESQGFGNTVHFLYSGGEELAIGAFDHSTMEVVSSNFEFRFSSLFFRAVPFKSVVGGRNGG